MSAERIDELLEKAARIDYSLQVVSNPASRPWVDAKRMEAAGYRAEALVLQLRQPREEARAIERIRCPLCLGVGVAQLDGTPCKQCGGSGIVSG